VGLLILFLAALGFLEVLGPVFGVRWGDPEMYPMTWLKETIKAAIPFRNTIGPRVFNAGILVSIMALIVLLNSFFGLVDFSWLGLRWQLFPGDTSSQSTLPRPTFSRERNHSPENRVSSCFRFPFPRFRQATG
jgi:hypothetical protein